MGVKVLVFSETSKTGVKNVTLEILGKNRKRPCFRSCLDRGCLI